MRSGAPKLCYLCNIFLKNALFGATSPTLTLRSSAAEPGSFQEKP
jgi:hypothetical protein